MMGLDLINQNHLKKWYVNTNQGCLGPLSIMQILKMGKKNEINSQNLVWHEGWSDWKAISEVNELELLFANNEIIELESKLNIENTESWNNSDDFWKEINQEMINFSSAPRSRLEDISVDKNQSYLNLKVQPEKNINHFKKKIQFILILVLFLSVCLFIILNFTMRNGFKKSSYKEYLEQALTRNEYRELISAIDESLEKTGPAASIGIINNNEKSKGLPIYFAVGTNLKDGTELKLNVWSTPGTLLSLNNVSVESRLVVKDGIAFSPGMLGKEEGPLAVGEYQVMVSCQKCKNILLEENKKEKDISLAQKAYFIGGKKDSKYLEELKVIQDKVNQKSKSELIEASQLIAMIRRQFSELEKNRSNLVNGKANRYPQLNQTSYPDWNQSEWIHIDQQLFVLIDRWKTLNLHNEVVHRELFGDIIRVYQKVKEIFEAYIQLSSNQWQGTIENEKIESLINQTGHEISLIEKKL